MAESSELVNFLMSTFYDITVASIKNLPGYDDKNYLVKDTFSKQKYILKIINPDNSNPDITDVICQVLTSLNMATYFKTCFLKNDRFVIHKIIKTTAGKSYFTHKPRKIESQSLKAELVEGKPSQVLVLEYLRGCTVLSYLKTKMLEDNFDFDDFYEHLGALCVNLSESLATQCSSYLLSSLAELRKDHHWTLIYAPSTIEHNLSKIKNTTILNTARRMAMHSVIDVYRLEMSKKDISKNLGTYRPLHSDLNLENMIVLHQTDVDIAKNEANGSKNNNIRIGIIDWMDVTVGPKIVELATLCLYLVLDVSHKYIQHRGIIEAEEIDDVLISTFSEIPPKLIKGYMQNGSIFTLNSTEIHLIPILMWLRLSQSISNAFVKMEVTGDNSFFKNNDIRMRMLDTLVTHKLQNITTIISEEWLKYIEQYKLLPKQTI